MFAVGGLLPLPIILLYGFSGGIVLAVSLVHVAVYVVIFYLAARWIGSVVRRRRTPEPVAAAFLLTALVGVSFLPIYGAGENLASGRAFRYNAYEIYRNAYIEVFQGGRRVSTLPNL